MDKRFWTLVVILDILFVLGGLFFGGNPSFPGEVGLIFLAGALVIVAIGHLIFFGELKFDSVAQLTMLNIIVMAVIVLLVWNVVFAIALFAGKFVLFKLIELLAFDTVAVVFTVLSFKLKSTKSLD